MTTTHKLILLLVLIVSLTAGSAVATWQVQGLRFSRQLTEQAGLHKDELALISNMAAAQARADQDKRLALEQRLSASDQIHYKELTDAKTKEARLRDSLATSDLRLSVLLAEDSAGGCSMPTSPGASGLVHGRARARLDPAHAQRIIGITDAGDQGLIALAACQAYVKEVSALK